MYNGFLKTVLFSLFLAILMTACLKNKEEPVAIFSMSDYVGQWKGIFPYNAVDDPSASELHMSLTTYAGNSILTGFINTPDGILILDNKMFFGGIFSFTVRNNSFDNPNCQSWDVGGSAYLLHINNIGLSFGGTFCGAHPKEIDGTITRESNLPDTTVFLTMAVAGRKLVYTVTDSVNISHDNSNEYQKDLANGLWRILVGREDIPYWGTIYRYITPVEWGELPINDSTPSHQQTNYRIDARVGTKYITVTTADSIIITIQSLAEMVTVPAGTFKCVRMTKEYRAITPGGFSGFFETWFNNNTGMIKTLQYRNDSVVMTEVLKEKNF